MKSLPIFISLIFLFSASCNARDGAVKRSDDKYSSMPCIEPFEAGLIKREGPAGKKSEASYRVKLKGFVETNTSGDVYIVLNPESKSRKSYLVTGELKQKVAAMKGKTVTVVCCYLERRYWSGIIRVYEIIR